MTTASRHLRAGAAALAIGVSASALAWDEPTTFWGLTLGHGIAEQLPECQRKRSQIGPIPLYEAVQPTRCWERGWPRADIVTLQANPELGVPAWGSAMLVDGKVEAVVIKFRQYEHPKVEALLAERFGPPHQSSTAEFTTRAGARVTGSVHEWRGSDVHISYSSYSDTIDRGHVIATTSAYRERERGAPVDNARQHKGNL